MYTNIPKPTGTSYTNVKNGYPLFDDPNLTYDDASWFFDGDSPLSYTNLPKPENGAIQWQVANMTWAQALFSWSDDYTKVSKP